MGFKYGFIGVYEEVDGKFHLNYVGFKLRMAVTEMQVASQFHLNYVGFKSLEEV